MTLHALKLEPETLVKAESETYTLQEGAARAGVPYGSFCRAVRCGRVPGVLDLGPRTKRISRSIFDAWLRGDA